MGSNNFLLRIYNDHIHYLGDRSVPVLRGRMDELLAGFFCAGPFYYYVIDSPTLTLENASESAMHILGRELKGRPLGDLISIVHPDDMDFFVRCEHLVAEFIQNRIAPEKIVNYKISYCLRERVKDGSYRLFLLQTLTLHTTPEGSLLKVLGVHTDITHITDRNNYKLSLIGLNGEPSYMGLKIMEPEFSWEATECPFTERELEVIRLLGEGLTSIQIAERLFVTAETIISHRKNAMAKACMKNSTQLVAFCIRQGYI